MLIIVIALIVGGWFSALLFVGKFIHWGGSDE